MNTLWTVTLSRGTVKIGTRRPPTCPTEIRPLLALNPLSDLQQRQDDVSRLPDASWPAQKVL